ncbi:hypothetical protein X777_05317 [Ooceraea biroi]|uniref:Uncharacterized protein n=1 Tax=Ooceraea biroi TaxID=2015173 RepID=A0A026X2G2_OOCBI|nr:hypothetical protein X777_05317 [Ooceraea biroi]
MNCDKLFFRHVLLHYFDLKKTWTPANDYHLFRSMKHALTDTHFSSYEEV